MNRWDEPELTYGEHMKAQKHLKRLAVVRRYGRMRDDTKRT